MGWASPEIVLARVEARLARLIDDLEGQSRLFDDGHYATMALAIGRGAIARQAIETVSP